jgi:hypothetical protein
MDIKIGNIKIYTGLSWLRICIMKSCCEDANEPSCSIKPTEFLTNRIAINLERWILVYVTSYKASFLFCETCLRLSTFRVPLVCSAT